MMLKIPKQAEAKRDDVITRKITISINFNALKNATYQPKSTVKLCYMYPRGLSGPPAMMLTK